MRRSRTIRMFVGVLALAMMLTPIVPSFAAEGEANKQTAEQTAVQTADQATKQTAEQTTKPATAALSSSDVTTFTDAFFNDEKVKKLAPGAVVVVVKDGKVLLQKGYGYSDVKNKLPMDSKQTVFRIGSVAKVFTAAAVMQQVEQGKIDLDADVQRYLGEAKLKNKTGSPLTMKHLLTHTSGVEHADALDLAHPDPNFTFPLKDYVRDQMPEITTTPGEVYSYDNFASMLQGYIVQEVSGTPFHKYVDKNILTPLGMSNSSFILTPELRSKLAKGYNRGNVEFPLVGLKPTDLPIGGMVSTGEDMAKFVLNQLNGGAYEGGRILQQESMDKMLNPQFSIHPQIPNMAYGYEFFNHSLFNGRHVVMKGGDLLGHSSELWLLPKENTGVFIFYNEHGPLRDVYLKAFMDRYYPNTSPKPEFLTPAKEQLTSYEGTFKDLRLGSKVIQIQANANGTLSVILWTGDKIEFKQVDETLFLSEGGLILAFKMKNGQITHLYNSFINPASWMVKLDKPVTYEDVSKNHPYRAYIDGISPLITLHGDEDDRDENDIELEPDEEMTRAEFAALLVDYIDHGNSYTKPVLKDVVHHDHAGAIQTVIDLGLVTIDKSQKFHPDKVIQRQEAADMVYRAVPLLYLTGNKEAKLSGKTDAWAVDAVKFIVANGYYGPEVKKEKDGSFNYQSHKPLLRQEAAAMFYNMTYPQLTAK